MATHAHAHPPRLIRLGGIAVWRVERGSLRWLRTRVRASEAWLIGVAVLIGGAAGGMAVGLSQLARMVQRLLFHFGDYDRLSALPRLNPAQLLVLPLGGLALGLFTLAFNRGRRRLVDAVEANALHGGRMSASDSVFLAAQTLISNGFGASVGLEAAYAQLGGGFASIVGQFLTIRRGDLRTLVGAGAGAAIAAAFGAPLTGAFYAFEIVIGSYTPAAIAPVTAAALAGTLVARATGGQPYVFSIASSQTVTGADYVLYAALGALCALIGIGLMQLVGACEAWTKSLPMPAWARPAIGGVLLVPLAIVSPQVLSSGHGALTIDLAANIALSSLGLYFALKCFAAIIALGFGFRGGMFFASLFLGSLVGHFAAGAVALASHQALVTGQDAALVGMAALAVSIVGGPFTMSMLVLEATHDFALTGAALAAALVASTIVRDRFGYSFSTWRLHLRGETVRSARDVGWARALTADMMMRRDPPTILAETPIGDFRKRYPLGSESRVVLVDAERHYRGLVLPTAAYVDRIEPAAPVATLAIQAGASLNPTADITETMETFDSTGADELAVTASDGTVLGTLSEVYVRRRYAAELDRSQRELFGEAG